MIIFELLKHAWVFYPAKEEQKNNWVFRTLKKILEKKKGLFLKVRFEYWCFNKYGRTNVYFAFNGGSKMAFSYFCNKRHYEIFVFGSILRSCNKLLCTAFLKGVLQTAKWSGITLEALEAACFLEKICNIQVGGSLRIG